MLRLLKLILTLLLVSSVFSPLGGCLYDKAIKSVGTLPTQLGNAVQTAVTQIADQGVMDKYLTNAEGQFIEPGFKAESCLCLSTTGKLVGTSGRIVANVEGTGSQLPAGLRDSLIKQLDGPISDSQRSAILGVLGWNRVVSPHNPVPAPPP